MESSAWHCSSEVCLAKRKVPVDCIYFRCSQAKETLLHALRQCPAADEVWKQLQFAWDQGCNVGEEEWFITETQRLNPQQFQQFGITLWTIWKNRNGELYGERQKPANVAANFIKHYLENTIKLN